jgi:hypothetical protein
LQTPKFSYPNTTQNDTQLSDELALYGSIIRSWNLITTILDKCAIHHPDMYDAAVVKQWYSTLTSQKHAPVNALSINSSNQKIDYHPARSLIIRNKKTYSDIKKI